ncbi:MAG: SCO family protein [Alphaproteobacteria bacterium]|nr:SCO family protein [Alphaproteobacteria bacterium]
MVTRAILGGFVGLLLAWPAAGHENHAHSPPKPAAEAMQVPANVPFPVAIDGRYALIDQDGVPRTQADFHGGYALIFFGYANCRGICSVALPRIAAALDSLGTDGTAVQPILITVDPINDTPAAMKAALPKIHPRLMGLTGDEPALSAARTAFQVKSKQLFVDRNGQPVFAHGGFIYLMGRNGELLTVMPPVLSPERMAELVRRYMAAG